MLKLIIAIAVATLWPVSGGVSAPHEHSNSAIYLDAARITVVRVTPRSVFSGEFDPDNSDEQYSRVDNGIGVTSEGCSDRNFLCFRMSNVVFAVPRPGLSSRSDYISAGTHLRIRKCYRYSLGKCRVALIESNCEWLKEPPGCKPFAKGRSASPRSGPVVYFFYNSSYGVTAFGYSGDIVPETAEAESASRTFVLLGNRGILADLH